MTSVLNAAAIFSAFIKANNFSKLKRIDNKMDADGDHKSSDHPTEARLNINWSFSISIVVPSLSFIIP